MPTPSSLEQVKELLANGNTEEAADMLLALSKASFQEHYTSALLLKNRIETLQHNVIDGVLSSNEERIEWARISRSVVDLVGQIDKGERPLPKEVIQPPPAPKPGPIARFPKPLLWTLPVVLLIVFFGIKNFRDDEPIEETVPPNRTEVVKEEMVTQKGRLINFRRKPLSGVKIIIKSVEGGKEYSFTTNERGEFSFNYPKKLERKQVHVTFEKNGKELDKKLIQFMPAQFNTITLRAND